MLSRDDAQNLKSPIYFLSPFLFNSLQTISQKYNVPRQPWPNSKIYVEPSSTNGWRAKKNIFQHIHTYIDPRDKTTFFYITLMLLTQPILTFEAPQNLCSVHSFFNFWKICFLVFHLSAIEYIYLEMHSQ